MRYLISFLFFFVFQNVVAQNDLLAKQYFEDGNFEKAAFYYEKLYEQNPNREDYLKYLITAFQQLEKYDTVSSMLLPKIENPFISPIFIVELGYNYMLQGNITEAQKYYQQAITKIEKNPSYAFLVGDSFKKKALLNEALRAYEKALQVKSSPNIRIEIAKIYGEQGNIEKMFDSYLSLINQNNAYLPNVLRGINQFISEDPNNENNLHFKKILLKKAQSNPNILWNELLSWLFVQQKQYNSAFIQEKAILKRSETTTIERIMDLGILSMENADEETAEAIFEYVIRNANNRALQLQAHLFIVDFALKNSDQKNYAAIEADFQKLIKEFGISPETINLQKEYANFLAFYKNTPSEGERTLKETLNLPLNRFEEAEVKMALADILVYDEKFNQALIYYSQIQKSLKNDVIAQKARFKVAKTSFYKGDFDWALTQLKVLRSSTTQLIANDAMQLSLLISDNSLEDSTQTALKIYAKADLLAYQNKEPEAITLLDKILNDHRGERIEDEALLKQGALLEKQKKYDKARLNYIKIIEFYSDDILSDDALYALAELYSVHFNNPEEAKKYYERIVFEHPDSIYFVESRKKFRKIRGDAIN
ncbi:tetratricopeptide repeat protein [Leptobacterium sp. I13]|uniref:tetratricopeptide repeat protein n=1 Tax=Leptobacterium meishanense TaxID=3128904 RepID=UPI0030EB8F26